MERIREKINEMNRDISFVTREWEEVTTLMNPVSQARGEITRIDNAVKVLRNSLNCFMDDLDYVVRISRVRRIMYQDTSLLPEEEETCALRHRMPSPNGQNSPDLPPHVYDPIPSTSQRTSPPTLPQHPSASNLPTSLLQSSNEQPPEFMPHSQPIPNYTWLITPISGPSSAIEIKQEIKSPPPSPPHSPRVSPSISLSQFALNVRPPSPYLQYYPPGSSSTIQLNLHEMPTPPLHEMPTPPLHELLKPSLHGSRSGSATSSQHELNVTSSPSFSIELVNVSPTTMPMMSPPTYVQSSPLTILDMSPRTAQRTLPRVALRRSRRIAENVARYGPPQYTPPKYYLPRLRSSVSRRRRRGMPSD